MQPDAENRILGLFAKKNARALSRKEIAASLPETGEERLDGLLEGMLASGALVQTGNNRFTVPALAGLKAGIFRSSGRGYGFVSPDGGGPDVFIPPKGTQGAWHNDRVLYRELGDKSGKGPEGEVERIASRGFSSVTGRLAVSRREAYVEPSEKRLALRIELNDRRLKGARSGDLVSVDILSYGDGKKPPRGELARVFGEDGTRKAACAAVLSENGIRESFPPEVLAEADGLPDSIEAGRISGRLDLRDRLVFTIDGDDAKDLDDAVSLQKDESGNWVLGVHIADVSEYVTPGSALDGEAFSRGTSVYYADRVIPMLPVKLSNGICSLNGGADRLAVSAFVTLDGAGGVLGTDFSKSVIRSSERMTYNNCNRLLEGGDPALNERYRDILPMLKDMSGLADALYKRRMRRGALDIETVESYIKCDETGAPVEILPRSRGISEKIIEEFMLCANEAVAEHLFHSERPAVYRVHEKPDPDKMAAFRAFAALSGYPLPAGGGLGSHALQSVLDRVKEDAMRRRISGMLLKSLMKARYSEQNLGHFGLAAKYYCHFTSPIRRYPDLLVHRFLKELLDGKTAKPEEFKLAAGAAAVSSDREVKADNAEREIEKIYKAEYMRKHIGERFEGYVSGVQPFGFFVELDNTVEGLVRAEELEGDEYVYNEEAMTLTGLNTKKVFGIGTPVAVECVAANPSAGEVDFRIV